MEVFYALLAILATILVSIVIWAHRQTTFWKRHKIPYVPASPFLGNFSDVFLLKCNSGDLFKNLYNHEAGKDQPIVGINIFHKPGLLIRDLGLIKTILVKDFNKFSHRYSLADPSFDTIGASNLFTLRNPEWKDLRNALTTFFSSGKMKQMFPLINNVGKKLDSHLSKISSEGISQKEFEMRELCALYTTDVIASVAFGIDANSISNPEGEFRTNGKKFFKFTFTRAFQFTIVFFLPQLVKFLRCKMFTDDVVNFLRKTTNFAIAEREKSGIKRNDLIDILIQLKSPENKQISERLTFEGDVIVSQTATFFLAGFETSSSTMSFALYELSKNPEIQDRLREEIRKVLQENNGDISYTAIIEMVYLHAVICESLRKYAPLPFLDRQCTLSKGESEYSLEPFVDFSIPEGMPIIIPVSAIQHDPQYHPNPEVFDPERFMPANKDKLIPYTYLAFGSGPHNCLGERLGLLQSKIGLVNFLKNHYVTCAPRSQELEFDKLSLNLQPKDGIFCYIKKDPLYSNK